MAQRFVTWLSNKFQQIEALVTSSGAADAGKIVATNGNGILDDTVINASTTGGEPNAGKIPKAKADGTIDETFIPPSIGRDTQVLKASEALGGGDAVNKWVDNGVTKLRLADANGKPADGYVKVAVAAGADATMYTSGTNEAVTGLTPGPVYLSSTPGKYSSTPPSEGSGLILQNLGWANSASLLDFKAGIPVTLAS